MFVRLMNLDCELTVLGAKMYMARTALGANIRYAKNLIAEKIDKKREEAEAKKAAEENDKEEAPEAQDVEFENVEKDDKTVEVPDVTVEPINPEETVTMDISVPIIPEEEMVHMGDLINGVAYDINSQNDAELKEVTQEDVDIAVQKMMQNGIN